MRKTGMPAVKAGAIEVAASTNGQLMPPIMGAAAFIIAEFIGITYFEVIKAAFIPAVISYIALMYISHLEALKLDLRGLPAAEIPPLGKTFRSGLHYLIPLVLLVYLLMVERRSPQYAVFRSILALFAIILLRPIIHEAREGGSQYAAALWRGFQDCVASMIAGARNMVGIAVAVATGLAVAVGAGVAVRTSRSGGSTAREVAQEAPSKPSANMRIADLIKGPPPFLRSHVQTVRGRACYCQIRAMR